MLEPSCHLSHRESLDPAVTPKQAPPKASTHSTMHDSVPCDSQPSETKGDKRGKEQEDVAQEVSGETRSQEEMTMELAVPISMPKNELAHEKLEGGALSPFAVVAGAVDSNSMGEVAVADRARFGDGDDTRVSETWETIKEEMKKLQRNIEILSKSFDFLDRALKLDAPTNSDSDSKVLGSEVRERLQTSDEIPHLIPGRREAQEETIERGEILTHIEISRASGSNNTSAHIALNREPTAILNTQTSLENKGSSSDQEVHFTPEVVSLETKEWGQSLTSEETTEPNSPIIQPDDPYFEDDFHHEDASRSGGISFQDIGLESLDDILGPEGSDLPPPVRPTRVLFTVTKASQIVEDGPLVDEDMKKQMDSMIPLNELPSPEVLKTGFDLNGSFKGKGYVPTVDYSPIGDYVRGEDFGYGRRPRNFNRNLSFERPRTPNGRQDRSSWARERDAPRNPDRGHFSYNDRVDDVDFFRYGIHYVPSETDSNYMRRIIISNLPMDVELGEVLARVRGGEVVSASLLDTEKLTGSITAMVEFLHEDSAEEYVTYTQDHPIHFGFPEQKADIVVINTPTWPLTTGSHKTLLERKQTRCLAIPSFSICLFVTTLVQNIAGNSSIRFPALVDIYNDEDGTLYLEFSSMSAANTAYNIITRWQIPRGRNVHFITDSCSGSMDELTSPLPPRRPVPVNRQLHRPSQKSSSSELRCSDSEVVREVEERKPIAALTAQKVIIPSFACPNLGSFSWADEVNDESEEEVPLVLSDQSPASSLSPNTPVLTAP